MYSHIVSSGFLSLETLRLRSLIQVNIIRRLLLLVVQTDRNNRGIVVQMSSIRNAIAYSNCS